MDFSLTAEQQMMREQIKKFMERRCPKEVERRLDEEHLYPAELYQELASLGLTAAPFPEEYGGTGGNIIDLVLILEELAHGNGPLAAAYLVAVLFGGEILMANGSEEQKRHFIPQIAAGKIKFAMALTEPDAGSDAARVKLTASRVGDNYLLNGTKMFITGAHVADYIVTIAISDKTLPTYRNMTQFIVPRDSKGLSTRLIPKLGGNSVGSNEVVYEDVVVPAANILGGPQMLNQGWWQLLKTLDVERICIAAQAVGAAQAAFEEALEYSKQRVQFNRPIGTFQINQHKLAEIATEIEAARRLTYYAAWLSSRGEKCSKEASMCKYYATDVQKRAALEGLQIMGGYGYTMEYNMQRYVRDALVQSIVGGTNEIQKNIIANMIGLRPPRKED